MLRLLAQWVCQGRRDGVSGSATSKDLWSLVAHQVSPKKLQTHENMISLRITLTFSLSASLSFSLSLAQSHSLFKSLSPPLHLFLSLPLSSPSSFHPSLALNSHRLLKSQAALKLFPQTHHRSIFININSSDIPPPPPPQPY